MLALLLAAAALSGCVFGGESERDLSEYFPPPPEQQGEGEAADSAGGAAGGAADGVNGGAAAASTAGYVPPAEDLENLEVASRSARFAVQSFFHLVSTGQLRSAYERTSTETRERITAEAFEQRYSDIWAEATIGGFSWAVVPQDDENAASHEVVLRYQTTFYGEIEEVVQARALRQPHWVVDWTPDLIFSGLGSPGYLIRSQIEVPERGLILDRNGVTLAGETEVVFVGVYPDAITDDEAVLDFFINRLGMEEDTVRERVYQDTPTYQFRRVAELAQDTSAEVVAEIEQLSALGILLARETRRYYPFGAQASHVVGYLQEIGPEELAERYVEGYRAGDLVGRDGIERSFERILAGRRGGRLYIVDPIGNAVREIIAKEAAPGANIRLTLDVRVQQLAENALGEQPGAVVAIDPRSGHVLAMASYPRIDYNTIHDGLTQEEYELYFFDERQPFINRAVEQIYAPGSTFKTVTLAAALEGGDFEITDRISCPAEWMEVGDKPLRNWKEVDQGLITLSQALAESCNTVFYEVGLELDRIDETLLPSVAAGFGLGQRTGIVGLYEESGVIPTPDWKIRQVNEPWYTGDTLLMSIGQGFVSVTVLQMANAYAALATNGVVNTPIIVQSIEPNGAPPQLIERRSISVLPVSADTLDLLQGALRTTVSRGYGTAFGVFSGSALRVAGKSGTAEDLVVDPEALAEVDVVDEDEDGEIEVELNSESDGEQQAEAPSRPRSTNHAWFAAWANFEDPSLVVTVVLDDGDSGSDDAGPIVRRVLEGAILHNWLP